MNFIVLTGRLTRDPELKYGQSGTAYCRFSLAVNRAFKRDEVDFINCVAFGKTAETIGQYLRKGNKAGIQGNLQMNRYEVNGEKRTSYDVVASQIEFLESKSSSTPSPFDNSNEIFGSESNKVQVAEPEVTGNDIDEDEFPF